MLSIFSWNRKHSIIPVVGVTAVTFVCAWKVIKHCTVPVDPHSTAIVYYTVRNQVLYTTDDPTRFFDKRIRQTEETSFSFRNSSMELVTPTRFPLLLRYLCHTFHLYSDTYVVVPPSSFFSVFHVPKTMWEPPGEECTISVRSVPTIDGQVNIALLVRYCLSFEELERFLAAVGPQSPIERIAVLAAEVLRFKCSTVSIGLLLSRSRCEGLFLPSLREGVASRLRSVLAIDVLDVALEKVEPLVSE